jgi:glycosyltransferase involved in cell wall biosynthesis
MSADGASGPLVTVVTPAYNIAQYIGEAVDSVLGQTFGNFEYLVIDDGSTDDSAAVAKAHAGADPRFRLIEGPNRGVSAARNTGIREAAGEYIAFLDGDDRWHPSFLERQIRQIQALPPIVGAVFCRSRIVLENGTPVFLQWQRAGRYDFDDLLVSGNPTRNTSSLLIRASCFADVGVFNEKMRYCEDLEMWLRITASPKTPILWATRHFGVDMRLRPGSATRSRDDMETAMDELLESQPANLRRLPVGLAYVRPAVTAFKYGENEELAERWARKARLAGRGRLARTVPGLRLLFWDTLSPPARGSVRSAQYSAREMVKYANRRLRGGVRSLTSLGRPDAGRAGARTPIRGIGLTTRLWSGR